MRCSQAFSMALLLIGTTLRAGTVTVGWDDDCDYDVRVDLDAISIALADGHEDIRVSNEQDYSQRFVITDSVTLRGGFANCADAAAGTHSGLPTNIDASGSGPTPIKVNSSGSVVDVEVSDLYIFGSTGNSGSGDNYAAALTIFGTNGIVTLRSMRITDNSDDVFAGGISIRNDFEPLSNALEVVIVDSEVAYNQGQQGGGVACFNDGDVTELRIEGTSSIAYNHATAHGGGLYNSGCDIEVSSGTASPSIVNALGIHGNTADGNGGGVAMYEGSLSLLGGTSHPVNVSENVANLDASGSGDGGGLFASGENAAVNAVNLLLIDNQTSREGGGAWVAFGAQFDLMTTERNCGWSRLCSLVAGNQANLGGAFYAEDGGLITLTGVEGHSNRAGNSGSFAHLRDDPSRLSIDSALLHHNGGDDHSEFSDNSLIVNAFGDNQIAVSYSTIADNAVQNATVSAHNGESGQLDLLASIVDDPGIPAVSFILPAVVDGLIECVIVADAFGINSTGGSNVIEASPSFVDRANADYHLAALPNMAVDQCASGLVVSPGPDMDGAARGTDEPTVPDNQGPFDIGVDEYSNDLIVKDGFE
ncbi:MAG: hypothetical protein DHS20C11_25310 [Lysobacteraceae bacterium]|nr:MAG: hypothetical protein DHS20C11_25310 [Xanthomonadaceae bacterium]